MKASSCCCLVAVLAVAVTTAAVANAFQHTRMTSSFCRQRQHEQQHLGDSRCRRHDKDSQRTFSPCSYFSFRRTTTTRKQNDSMRRHMFTGIVEEMGTVIRLDKRNDMVLWDGSTGTGTELTIAAKTVLDGAYLGCSICVSGVCLTATEIISATASNNNDNEGVGSGQFKVGLAPETLRRTYFDNLKAGDAVNLERASEIGGRNSGHFVQGHVDCTGTILERYPDENSLVLKIQVDDPTQMAYIVPKGFIAIDGTSLTVVQVNVAEAWFTVMLVEYTQKKIILPLKAIHDKVNLEVDVLGKYSENAMRSILPRLEALEAKVTALEKALSLSQQQQRQ